MVNTEDFVERLERLLQFYAMSASAFADKINVQRSSISHLLSGRNKPSLDFVMKVVRTFPEVNLYWLLNGKGSFPDHQKNAPTPISPVKSTQRLEANFNSEAVKEIDRIIIFYADGSFDSYNS